MRAPAVLNATLNRLKSPVYLGVILAVCALWALVPWVLGLGGLPLHTALSPLYWSLVILLIFPLPWQWTGDARPLAPFTRGLFQALLWNGLWAAGITAAILLSGAGRQEHHPHPMEPVASARPVHRLPFNPRILIGGLSFMALGMLIGWLLANKERAEAGEHEAVRAATEARMHMLQSQMNPHVLFNAISGLAELVREDPEATEKALLSLASFLRDLLDCGAHSTIPLALERVMVERYLALEQIRLGQRLRLSWDWNPALATRELPPLMLQPLVENAIKHGLAPHRGGGELRIRLASGEAGLELEVANTGASLVASIKEGVGLRNLKERLAHFDPGATLSLTREGDWTRAQLRLGSGTGGRAQP